MAVRPLTFPLPEAQDLFARQAEQLLAAASSLSDLQLLDPSLCRGWSRLELVEHVRLGLDEMAAAAGSTTTSPPDQDAASYWAEYAGDEDPVPGLMWLRRVSSASARPSGAVERLRDSTDRAVRAVQSQPDAPVPFQGHVLRAGDFVGSWVVELAVHQWDLALPDGPVPAGSGYARRTVEALGATLPASMTDEAAVLAALGRRPWPEELPLPEGLPRDL